MNNKVAIVTGGVGDLGRAISKCLICEDIHVAALDISADSDHAVAWKNSFNGDSHRLKLIQADINTYEGSQNAVSQVIEKYGRIDILVNCAGITRDNTMRKMALEDWRAVIDTNLNSVFNVTRQVINSMIEQQYGRIVNISSVNGVKGQFGQSNYAAAKAGIHGLTMSLAQELAREGITVNTVAPGYMNTKMVQSVPENILQRIISEVPVGRLGEPSEIGEVVKFLASEHAGFITGSCLNVNGGLHMH